MAEIVYLNGEFVPLAEAKVPIDDRGYQFADGVYEVVRCYGGEPFLWEEHMRRLAYSAGEVGIAMVPPAELERAARELIRRNGVLEAAIYIQVNRGVAPRIHLPPEGLKPSVVITTRPAPGIRPEAFAKGGTMITVPDLRWERCDLKTVGLLLNVLAKQEAHRRGAHEALFVRNGLVTEGSSTNFFAVIDGVLRTHPKGRHILPGITRDACVTLAAELDIPVAEQAFTPAELDRASEAFLTSTTQEVFPIVAVDGKAIGDGRPGPVTQRLAEAYRAWVQGQCAARV